MAASVEVDTPISAISIQRITDNDPLTTDTGNRIQSVTSASGDASAQEKKKGISPICAKPGTDRRLVAGRLRQIGLIPFFKTRRSRLVRGQESLTARAALSA